MTFKNLGHNTLRRSDTSMYRTRKFLNHITIFAAFTTIILVVLNLLSDEMDDFMFSRKINRLESKLDRAKNEE